MIKRFGFTLSEVLITLAIIGVVAAMTVPTVITKYNNSEYAARTKKLYGVVSSAIEEAFKESGGNNITVEQLDNAINSTLRVKNLGSCFGYSFKNLQGGSYGGDSCPGQVYQLPDGSIFGFYTRILNYSDASGSYRGINLYFDGNGKKGPNQLGRDIYMFVLHIDNPTIQAPVGNYFCDKNETHNYNGENCSRRLMQNGWEIDW